MASFIQYKKHFGIEQKAFVLLLIKRRTFSLGHLVYVGRFGVHNLLLTYQAQQFLFLYMNLP